MAKPIVKLRDLGPQLRQLAQHYVGGCSMALELGWFVDKDTRKETVNVEELGDNNDLIETLPRWREELVPLNCTLDFYVYGADRVGGYSELRDNMCVRLRRGKIVAVNVVGSDWKEVA